jgi:hypothetical protein
MQIPAGRVSDRVDRRYVLAGLGAIASASGIGHRHYQTRRRRNPVRPDRALWRNVLHALFDHCGTCQRLRGKRSVRDSLQRFAAALRHWHHHRPARQAASRWPTAPICCLPSPPLPISRSPPTPYSEASVRAAVPDAEKKPLPRPLPPVPQPPNRSISIRAQPHPRIDHAAAKVSPGIEHDLSDVLAIFHALMRGRRLFHRIDRIHHRQHLAFIEQRPDMLTQFAGDHRLEGDVARAQR